MLGHRSIHYSDIIIGAMASQITGMLTVYLIICSGAYQRKHQSSVSLAFVRGIHWWPVNSSHKGPVTRRMFTFDDVVMYTKGDQVFFYVKMFVLMVLNTLPRADNTIEDGSHKWDLLHFENSWTHQGLNIYGKGLVDNTSALVQVMAWHWIGDKPSPESIWWLRLTWDLVNTGCGNGLIPDGTMPL